MIDFEKISNDYLDYKKVVKEMLSLRNIDFLISLSFFSTIAIILSILFVDFLPPNFFAATFLVLFGVLSFSVGTSSISIETGLLSYYNKKTFKKISDYGFDIHNISEIGCIKNKDLFSFINSFTNLPKSSQKFLNNKQDLFFEDDIEDKEMYYHFDFFKNSILNKKITLLDIENAYQYYTNKNSSIIIFSEKYIFHLIELYLLTTSAEDIIKHKLEIINLVEMSIKDPSSLEDIIDLIDYNVAGQPTRKAVFDKKLEKLKQAKLKGSFLVKSI